MQPAFEFRHALLSAPNLSVPFTFPGTAPLQKANPNDPSAQLTLVGHDLHAVVSDAIGGPGLVSPDTLAPDARLQLGRMRASGELLARLMDQRVAVHQAIALIGHRVIQMEALRADRGQA